MKALLIFPHQLFTDHPGLALRPELIAISEDPLFFGDKQYPANFHRQKLMLHRASMRYYARTLSDRGHPVRYFEYASRGSPLPQVVGYLAGEGVTELYVSDVADFALQKRLLAACDGRSIALSWLENPGFINSCDQNRDYRGGKKRWFMADFYRWQRKRLSILLDDEQQPLGGQWSFDENNRKKLPKKKILELPELNFPETSADATEARKYVNEHFADAYGVAQPLLYPLNHEQALRWLNDFLTERFAKFGPYEDAIVEDQKWLYHSVLTPMLNIGLLTPTQVVQQALRHAEENHTPLASVEGFVRQIIGWREFMRATYVDLGVTMRTTNTWRHCNPMPDTFYSGTTGIAPIDNTIKRVLQAGYCHHIERLMVLGGFMFLCEIDPDAIYRWFMELFVDSYDWVMVSNVYAMSQNADGGLITTKPYFSGSNYVRKMSHYPKGEWCDIWDALYWRWIINHAADLGKNPRWAMMVKAAQKMDDQRQQQHLQLAERYLATLIKQ